MSNDPNLIAINRKIIFKYLKSQHVNNRDELWKSSYSEFAGSNFLLVTRGDNKVDMKLTDYAFLPEDKAGQSLFHFDHLPTIKTLRLTNNYNEDQELIKASLDKLIAGLATIPGFSELMIMKARVPEQVVELRDLTSLAIDGTQYVSCPKFLAQMQQLTSLAVVAFWPLDESLISLQNLQTIHILKDQVSSLQAIIDQMPNLDTISVYVYGDHQTVYTRDAFIELEADAADVVQPVVILNVHGNGEADKQEEEIEMLEGLLSGSH